MRARSASTALSTAIIYRHTLRSLAFVLSLAVEEVLVGTSSATIMPFRLTDSARSFLLCMAFVSATCSRDTLVGAKEINSQEIAERTTKALEELSEALAAGKSETFTAYLAAIGRFHKYSPHNVMLIVLQKPAATDVAGSHTWHKLGRLIRRLTYGIEAEIIGQATGAGIRLTDADNFPASLRLPKKI
jgi:hypothetical protein